MPFFFFVWTDEIIEHLSEHGVTPEEFEQVVCDPISIGRSRTTGRPRVYGFTEDGRFLICVYEHHDADSIIPVTAWEPTKE